MTNYFSKGSPFSKSAKIMEFASNYAFFLKHHDACLRFYGKNIHAVVQDLKEVIQDSAPSTQATVVKALTIIASFDGDDRHNVLGYLESMPSKSPYINTITREAKLTVIKHLAYSL